MPKGGNNKLSQEEFIIRAKKIHNNYDYSLVEYKGQHTKVKIICKIHGIFEVTPNNHTRKMQNQNWNPNGCPQCGKSKTVVRNKEGRLSNDYAIERLKPIHGDLYEYISPYMGCREKLMIICQDHGVFEQNYTTHFRGSGCPRCKNSKGEKKIENILKIKNLTYNKQHKFNDCVGNKKQLLFDFYLPDIHTVIEYDGEQHFKPVCFHKNMSMETATKMLEQTILYDTIKNEYCKKNNITIIRISYKNIKNCEKILELLG